jgi:phosphoglycolate phosphatase
VSDFSAIIFDLDGTLVDSSEAIVECINWALSQKQLPPAPARVIKKSIGTPLEDMFAPFTDSDPGDLVRLYRERYRQVFLQRTRLLPGVSEVLDSVRKRGYRIALATTKPRYFAEPILEHLGIRGFFDAVAGGEEVTLLKPAPDLLFLAMERLRASSEETLYVGDHPVDIAAAKSAGIRIICVTTGFWSRAELEERTPALVIDNLQELLPLVPDRAEGNTVSCEE